MSSKELDIDYFDFSVVNSDLKTLQGAYEDFYKAMQRIDVKINTMLQIPDGGALYGTKGESFLNDWNDKCAGFKSYYYLFKEWSSRVINISNIYADFQGKVLGDSAEKVDLEKIEENVEAESVSEARMLTALLLGAEDIDGQNIVFQTINGKEYAFIGDNKFLITRDENNNIIEVTDESGNITEVDNRIVEERIVETYNAHKNGEISTDEWDEFYDSLTEEGRQYVMYLETGATLYTDAEIESILKDYASASLNLTGAGNIYAYRGDVVVSNDGGIPYEFMGLTLIDDGGYLMDKPIPVFKMYGATPDPHDPLGYVEAYTYVDGQFVKLHQDASWYEQVVEKSSAISFEDGSGPARVIPAETEREPGAVFTTHAFGVPEADDPRIVVVDSDEVLNQYNGENWSDLPKILYVPEGKYIHDNRGGGIFDLLASINVKGSDNKGFYLVRDDESYSYWLLDDEGNYYVYFGNDTRLDSSALQNGWLSLRDR